MRILLKLRRLIAAMLIIPELMLCTACGRQSKQTPEQDYKAEAEAVSVYCVSKENCFLCGEGSGDPVHKEYFCQNNVGIISLNTFEVMPVEINRYDHSGQLIEENTGAMQMRFFKNGDDGMSASVMLEPDRGIAHVSISPKGDATIDLGSAAAHLCPDCLSELVSHLYGNASGVGVIYFSTRRLYAIQESATGFGAGDYYVHCDPDAESGEINILITYSPLRYEN